MKPFLSIDLTADKHNEQANGSEFLIQVPSATLSKSLETSSEKVEKTVENSKIPKFFRVTQFVCGIITLLIINGLLRSSDVSFAEGYQNAPWLYWAAGICIVLWLTLWLWSKRKSKTILEADESTQTFSHFDGVANAIYTELSVPDDAKDVDVLIFFYKIKNGEIKLVEKSFATHLNLEFKLFTDEQNLYLANLEGKYAFSLSSVVKVHTVKKHIRIAGWNKNEAHNKGIYKKFKLTADNYGCIHCKQYHIIEIDHQGENYGLYIPSYELPSFEECTK